MESYSMDLFYVTKLLHSARVWEHDGTGKVCVNGEVRAEVAVYCTVCLKDCIVEQQMNKYIVIQLVVSWRIMIELKLNARLVTLRLHSVSTRGRSLQTLPSMATCRVSDCVVGASQVGERFHLHSRACVSHTCYQVDVCFAAAGEGQWRFERNESFVVGDFFFFLPEGQ